jgi:hypothetical protein
VGVVILKDIISRPFNDVEENGYLKILIENVWGNYGRGRWAFALLSLLIIKKGTSLFNFQWNEPFSKVLRQLIDKKCPGLRNKIKL